MPLFILDETGDRSQFSAAFRPSRAVSQAEYPDILRCQQSSARNSANSGDLRFSIQQAGDAFSGVLSPTQSFDVRKSVGFRVKQQQIPRKSAQNIRGRTQLSLPQSEHIDMQIDAQRQARINQQQQNYTASGQQGENAQNANDSALFKRDQRVPDMDPEDSYQYTLKINMERSERALREYYAKQQMEQQIASRTHGETRFQDQAFQNAYRKSFAHSTASPAPDTLFQDDAPARLRQQAQHSPKHQKALTDGIGRSCGVIY